MLNRNKSAVFKRTNYKPITPEPIFAAAMKAYMRAKGGLEERLDETLQAAERVRLKGEENA